MAIFRVIYGFQGSNNKASHEDAVALVNAADDHETTIKAVLTSNNISRPGTTLAIRSISVATGGGGTQSILS
jgi:hypothetical protein